MKLTFGSLFAGIGGFDLGFERAGMVCEWQVEIDDWCNRVLAKHWPDVRRYRDVKEVGKHNLKAVDVICGGFPCQPHSFAGIRNGTSDTRNLWPDFSRVIGEIRPRWIVAENVRGLFSSDSGRFFSGILRDLAGFGYDAEWSCISACEFGASHSRPRVFLLAHATSAGREARSTDRLGNIMDRRPTDSFTHSNLSEARQAWESEPRILGVSDGVPSRVDRLRGLGNAVVPQVAEWLGARIVAADSMPRTIGYAEGVT